MSYKVYCATCSGGLLVCSTSVSVVCSCVLCELSVHSSVLYSICSLLIPYLYIAYYLYTIAVHYLCYTASPPGCGRCVVVCELVLYMYIRVCIALLRSVHGFACGTLYTCLCMSAVLTFTWRVYMARYIYPQFNPCCYYIVHK